MKNGIFLRSVIVVSGMAFLAFNSATVFGQADKYKPGSAIEYLDTSVYPPKWEKGVYVRATPGGSQPVIRQKPSEFFPEGSETATSWDKIRPVGPPPKPPAEPDPDPQPAPAEDAGNDPPVDGACTTMLGEDDVLTFLQKNLGNDPFKDSYKKERVENELAGMIRNCGVNFRYVTFSPFDKKLSKYSVLSTVIFPLRANYGPPTKQAWYNGTWPTSVQSEDAFLIIAAKAGSLTINANETYVWKLFGNDPPSRYLRGKWRPSTAEEMKVSYQGGSGVVLLDAKEHYDWIVRQDRETTLAGRWIIIANINSRQQREFGHQK